LEAIHFGGWIPTRDVQPEVVAGRIHHAIPPVRVQHRARAGRTRRRHRHRTARLRHKLIHISEEDHPIFRLHEKTRRLSRIIPIYIVSPTGWQDTPINLQVPASVNYPEFLYLIHTHCLYNIHDAYLDLWCRRFQVIGHVTSGSYLQVYLCLSTDILGYSVQGIIACFSAEPRRVGAVLPEILWSGPHRHVTLRDWYPQTLQDKGWYLLVIPSIPDYIFHSLSQGDQALLDALHKMLEAHVVRSMLANVLQRSGLLKIATSPHWGDGVDTFLGDPEEVIRDRVTAITAMRFEEVTVATAVPGG